MRKTELCEMRSEYSKADPCEHENNCKLLAMLKENKKLKKENNRLRNENSWGASPTIGEAHEMGAW